MSIKMIPTEPKICVICGANFARKPGYSLSLWQRRKCCCKECKHHYNRINKFVFQSGHKGYKNSGNFKKGHYSWNTGKLGRMPWCDTSGLQRGRGYGFEVSESTREKIRIARAKQTNIPSGEKHWNWRGGISDLRDTIRQTALYKNWRRSVYIRDNFTCQMCNKRGGHLHVDHIKSFSKIMQDNKITSVKMAKECTEFWDVSNGRVLCVKCHFLTDTYGAKSILKN